MKDLVRHGDLLFCHKPIRPVGELRCMPGSIIQKGEVTGHAHRLTEGDAMILAAYETAWDQRGMRPNGARYLEVTTPATITHEEHKPVTLAPGLWEIIQAREFDYAANLGRRVRD